MNRVDLEQALVNGPVRVVVRGARVTAGLGQSDGSSNRSGLGIAALLNPQPFDFVLGVAHA
jgi:hypothetical protein